VIESAPCRVRILVDFISPTPETAPLRAAFEEPSEVLVAESVQEIRDVLDAVNSRAKEGRWCIGFVRYDAAPAFDSAFVVHPSTTGPLAWFGVFDGTRPWSDDVSESARVDWQEPLCAHEAKAAITSIHRMIEAGEVYQINHTAQMKGVLRKGQARSLFAALQRAQPGTYAAFIDTGSEQILSVSPELFFDWQESGQILARPMKGTAPRGASPSEDQQNEVSLRTSEKERAENVMIVDLIRNDLSRIAEPYSVVVPRLFHTEPLPTVWSMTSDVVACTRQGTTLAQVFEALFPCGSVTGAPKVQAMRTIRKLETDPRGVYCGAVGVVRPGGAATFNVAIRTVAVDREGSVRCGIGSGITIDAGFDREWSEWRYKAAFVQRASAPFALLETLRIDDGEICDVQAHLDRLENSAAHFRYPYEKHTVTHALEALTSAYTAGTLQVRVLLHSDGRVETSASPLSIPAGIVWVQLAQQPLREAHDEFVRFKTTRDEHYQAFLSSETLFDILLWNEYGEVTEFTRGNVAVKLDGRWITPSVESGLLPGMARARALAEKRLVEGNVRIEDLGRAEGVAFLSSVVGWVEVQMTYVKAAHSTYVPGVATEAPHIDRAAT
jgi:para-aminobenzoate synthetase / 4-amino-4-deoxychorismate lyase